MFYMYIVNESDDEITTDDDEEIFETEAGNLSGGEVEMDGFLVEV